MGVVWRVFDREWGRDLALKLPRPVVLESPPLRERYVREAETWIGLGVHPHIVQCWFVTLVEGVPALFLDYLTGGSLASWMENGHVKPGQWTLIIEIAMQVAEGLAYAHSKGVIHRDVKPENLLIRGDERVCVTDFGLVKTAVTEELTSGGMLEDWDEQDAGVTGVGAYLGTPMYGAPEQWGAAERVGPPADIYALGVTLYEMCCGRRPFDVDDEQIAPMDLIRRHLADPPPDPREFHRRVPPELAALCLEMLAKDPAKRPGQMVLVREMLHDIHQKLSRRAFRAPDPLMGGAQSSDVLNNQAVSLLSLGKLTEALETLRRGLNLDPGHPECLYNLVQLEKRYGRIGHLEALRRLKQARAHYPLALLLIEEGMPAEALETLKEVSPQTLSSPGLHHRATGDALMYLRDFSVAEIAYAEAQGHMPKDAVTQHRRALAAAGRGDDPGGGIYFPSFVPRQVESNIDNRIQLALDARGEGLIGITQENAVYRPLLPGAPTIRVARQPTAGRVSQIWTYQDRLAIADAHGFEFRRVPSMQLLARRQGRLLACSPRVEHIVTLEQSGPQVYVMSSGEFMPIRLENQRPDQGPLLAAFDRGGEVLGLLLPSGHLAFVGDENCAVQEPWPSRVEDHREAKCLALGPEKIVLLGFANGIVRGYNVNAERVDFNVQLPEAARSMEVRAAGTRIIVRTVSNGFFVLNRAGQILLAGDGPLAVDPQGTRILALMQGRQLMYNLNPLSVLRRWPQVQLEKPKSVGFSGDGRLAVVMSIPGAYSVWEVDEPRRVYQRDLLQSPGRSYADILSAHQQFHRHLDLAREALGRREYAESHRHLQRARKVPGYGQGGDALELSWQLLDTLKRDRLEAVWERLSIEEANPGDVDLHQDGRELLFSFGEKAYLALDQDGGARTVWTVARRGSIRLCRFVMRRGGGHVLILDETGQAALHHLADGRLVHEFGLDGGPLLKATLEGSYLTYLCQGGGMGQFDLTDGSHFFREVGKFQPRLFTPWQQDKVLVTGPGGFGILDLAKPGSKLQPPKLGVEITKLPCFIEHFPERSLVVLGFMSGTLRVIDLAGGGILASLRHGTGNRVTSFELLPQLSVAVTTTSRGQIFFWDLRSDTPLDEFVVHRDGVSSLRISRGGRYLLTSGKDGIIRYWETSWSTGEVRASKNEIPWACRGKSIDRFSKARRGASAVP